jgi:hypothetical protein
MGTIENKSDESVMGEGPEGSRATDSEHSGAFGAREWTGDCSKTEDGLFSSPGKGWMPSVGPD